MKSFLKRKRPEESTLFHDTVKNDINETSIITPNSNPFNISTPVPLEKPSITNSTPETNGVIIPQTIRPTPESTPVLTNSGLTPFLLDTPTGIGASNITNEKEVFDLFNKTPVSSGITSANPFNGISMSTPAFDIPTPMLTSEGFFPPQFSTPSQIEPTKIVKYEGYQPPPPPVGRNALPPLPQPMTRDTKRRRSSADSPTNNGQSMEEDDDEDSHSGECSLPAPTLNPSIVPFSSTNGNPSAFFRIAEGLNKPNNVKYLGGKQNTQYPLPTQLIELDWNKIPGMLMEQFGLTNILQLSCRSYILGFDRQKRAMIPLSNVSNDKRFHETPDGRWVAAFGDIFVQYASHNYGQRLALRFHLVMTSNINQQQQQNGLKLDAAPEERVLCQIDSTEFQTITKRGLEKEQQRERTRIEKHKYGAIVERAHPAVGLPVGGQLVKIYLSGMVGDSTGGSASSSGHFLSQSQVTVYFGDQASPEIHSVKKNVIVCETPEHPPGVVGIIVSLIKKDDEGTVLTSNAKFEYLDMNARDTSAVFMSHFLLNSAPNEAEV